jgi:peptidoglycan/xylan/chitin deacetylase (PgdA/CDA1 family)
MSGILGRNTNGKSEIFVCMPQKESSQRLGHLIRRNFFRLRMTRGGWGVILLYHRIASPAIDPLLLSVSPAHFREHLEVLRREYHPLSLQALGKSIKSKSIPPWSVAITFDDGYADNHTCAAPLLEEAGMRGTVFVVGQALEGKEFFYDELEDILFQTRKLPEVLRFPRYGKEWSLGHWSTLPEQLDSGFWDWHIGMQMNPTNRHKAYREIFTWLRGATKVVREDVMEQMRGMAGRELYRPQTPRGMSRDEVREAGQKGILEIGAHTMTHPVLSELDNTRQMEDIMQGKRAVEAALDGVVQSFAYPYGTSWDVARDTPALSEMAGFNIACANMEGTVDHRSSPHWLPRFLVRDWTGEEFARQLELFFIPRTIRPPLGK